MSVRRCYTYATTRPYLEEMQVISKPRRKRLSIESASARPTCEGCKQSSSVPDGQENEAIQQLDGDWLCPRHLSEALDQGAYFNWLVRVLGLAQKGAGTHAYLPHQPFARLDRLRLVCRIRVGPQWTRLPGKQPDDD